MMRIRSERHGGGDMSSRVTEPLLIHTKTCNWVPGVDDGKSLVDFVGRQELVENTVMHGPKWSRAL